MGVAYGLRMRKMNNCQKVNFAEIDAGGGPETGILLVVALYMYNKKTLQRWGSLNRPHAVITRCNLAVSNIYTSFFGKDAPDSLYATGDCTLSEPRLSLQSLSPSDHNTFS